MTRTIIGNLFVESTWARSAAAARRAVGIPALSSLDPRFLPPEDVMARLAAMATLLRAFAAEGDVIWTPRPVPPDRMTDVPGVPRPLLISGARPTPGPGDLAWGEVSDASVAANDRRLACEVQRSLGCALPEARVVEDVDQAAAAVRAAAGATKAGKWVVKAVHSSAGRSRVGGSGPDLDEAHANGIDHLLALHAALVVEPWLARTADFGAVAVATDAGAEDVLVHELLNTARGEFRGVSFPAASLRPDEKDALRVSVDAAARALAAVGWRGPFGVDAFRWRDDAGVERFHPLCEINARLTFGRVSHAFANRISAALGRSEGAPWRFRVGASADLAAARATTPPPRLHLLLRARAPDGVTAWIDL